MLSWLYHLSDQARQRARNRLWAPTQASGRRGEDIAHRFLRRDGFVIVARNYRHRGGLGEVDLIAWDKEILVIVEVKSRFTDEYGAPDRAVDREKKIRLLRAAREYARRAEVSWDHVRFDIVNILFTSPPSLTHMRDVFHDVPPASSIH